MRAMVLEKQGEKLIFRDVKEPIPRDHEILIPVHACGICRTDLHVVDGDLKSPHLPLIPGHQIVGVIEKGNQHFNQGERVGVPWLGRSCGQCEFCIQKKENL